MRTPHFLEQSGNKRTIATNYAYGNNPSGRPSFMEAQMIVSFERVGSKPCFSSRRRERAAKLYESLNGVRSGKMELGALFSLQTSAEHCPPHFFSYCGIDNFYS